MFTSSNQVIQNISNNGKSPREKLLNSKTYHLNNSLSKFVSVGLAFNDLTPRIIIGGQQGFQIILHEGDWNTFVSYEGVIANYFYSNVGAEPLVIGKITVLLEKFNNFNIIKIQDGDANYICLGCESVDKLWALKDLVEYRIQILKKQEFEKYFNLFQRNIFNQEIGDVLTNVYDVLNPKQNTNSENVSTMMEMLILYPQELENKLKKSVSSKRKYYYEEVSEF